MTEHLSGQGFLIAEGHEVGVAVTYELRLKPPILVGGTYSVSASVQTAQQFHGIPETNAFHLQLADGTRVGVFIEAIEHATNTCVLGIRDANDLVRKYKNRRA